MYRLSPRVGLFIFLLFFFSLAHAVTYTWNTQVAGNLNYTNGNMVVTLSNTNFDTRGPQDPNGGASNGYKNPKYISAATINTYQGGFTNDYGMPGLVLGVDWPNLTSTTTVNIVFTVPVAGPATFDIYDLNIGSWGGNAPVWVDKLTISGTNCSGGLIYPTKSGCSSTTSGANNNVYTGVMGCTNTTNSFTINSPTIKSITILYSSGSPLASGYGNDPDPQYVIISDITTGNPLSVTVAPNAGIGCSSPAANLSASSNITGATFAWSGPSPSTSPAGTTPNNSSTIVSSGGTYTVIATDPSTGCTVSASTTVNQSSGPPTASIAPPAALNCTVTSVTLTASSSTPGVMYAWSGGGTSPTKVVTVPGTYTVTVTDPVGGCTSTASATVAQSATSPTASIAPPAALSCTVTNITLTTSSSTLGVTYAWSGGGTSSTKVVTAPGTYTVTVTDPVGGCTSTASATVAQSATSPTTSIAPPAALSCTVTSVTLTASSSTPGVTYAWSGGGTGSNKVAAVPGIYTVTVTDPGNGCTATANATVTASGSIPNISIAPHSDLNCINSTVILTAASSTPNATFDWGGGNNTITNIVSLAGSYSVTVTDPANGCQTSANTTVLQDVNVPIVSLSTPPPLTCTITSVTLSATSSTNTVVYSWGGGNTSNSNVVVSAGNYVVTVTDTINGCTATASASVSQTSVPPTVNVSATGNLSCTTSTVMLTASTNASNAGYDWGNANTNATYSVSNPGIYTITVTDQSNGCSASASTVVAQNINVPVVSISVPGALNCVITSVTLFANTTGSLNTYSWSNSATSQTISVTTPGNFTVTVTDLSNGCSASASATVSQNTSIPQVSIAPPLVLGCNVNSVTLVATSNLSSANFVWSNGSSSNTSTVSSPGSYTVTVTDPASSCTSSASAIVLQTASLSVTVPPVPVLTCITSTVSLNAAASSSDVTYNWNTGQSINPITVSNSGNYSVTVTDTLTSCTALASVDVNQNITAPLVTVDLPEQLSSTNTSITLQAHSNSANGLFVWGNGTSFADNTVSAPGTYSVTVTDPSTGCTASANAVVYEVTDHYIYIPNSFTPNNDGNNDYFSVYGSLNEIAFIEIQIFNRWGEKVFESNDHHFMWDGTFKGQKQNPQVFIWQLKITFLDGSLEKIRKGSLTLIR